MSDRPTTPAPAPAANGLPFWLRAPRRQQPKPATTLTMRDPRWWIGVVWLGLSVLLLGFVGHATLFGILQHDRSQADGYQQLRISLAKAETPLGQLDLSEELVDPGTPVALVTIEAIGLNEVIRQGTSPDVLRDGAGHRRDSVMPGQEGTAVLYGRQSTYGGPFGQLAALIPGDEIEVTTGQGTFTYEVLGLRRAGDPLPVPLGDDEGRLQLVTAEGPALAPQGALYVDATLDGRPTETPGFSFTSAVLNEGEGVMESDPSSLLPLLFTFQWFAVAIVVARWLFRAWGRWQTWTVAGPVLLVLSAATADRAMALLPNLI